VVLFAASVDTLADITKFAEKLGVDYPLLSDPTREAAKSYGVVEDDQSYARRWVFYIGVDGKILYIDKAVRPADAGTTIAQKLAELGVARRGTRKGGG
jgi:thioredoxin-dependent peroxiredoxin